MTDKAFKGMMDSLEAAWPGVISEIMNDQRRRAFIKAEMQNVDDPVGMGAAARMRRDRKHLFKQDNFVAILLDYVQQERSDLYKSGATADDSCPECDKGWLELVTSSGWTVCIPCPYCDQGNAHRMRAKRTGYLGRRLSEGSVEQQEAEATEIGEALGKYHQEREARLRSAAGGVRE